MAAYYASVVWLFSVFTGICGAIYGWLLGRTSMASSKWGSVVLGFFVGGVIGFLFITFITVTYMSVRTVFF